VGLSSGAVRGIFVIVQMHKTSVLFVLFTRSVGSFVAEQPSGAMFRAWAKTWSCTERAQAGRDWLKSAREEKGAAWDATRERAGRRRRIEASIVS
jgi:hypothetical protein